MRSDFFRLTGSVKVLKSPDELLEIIHLTDAVNDLEYEPAELSPPRPRNRIKGKRFTNVSFSKTLIKGLEFTQCEFLNCLFIGSVFQGCEFHDCTFRRCNPHKIKFKETYIDPACFINTLEPSAHSNIGVWLFQQLYHNSAEMRQNRFAQTAEYHFLKWSRYQLTWEFKSKHISCRQYLRRWLPSFLYDHLAGYGILVLPFTRLTVALLAGMTVLNHFAWALFKMKGGSSAIDVSWVRSLYYTVVTMTTLGYGDITPTSDAGMLLASAEALFGIIWLSLLASIIIKRVTR